MARRRVFQRAAARRTTWEGAQIDLVVPSSDSISQVVITEALFEEHPNPTIVRMRGHILLRQTTQSTTITTGVVFMGIKLATASAVASGITALETPFTEIGSDWIWWETRALSTLDSTLGQSNGTQTHSRVLLDSKAMRKVQPNQVLVFVAQHTAIAGTQTSIIVGGIRILLKQP